MPEGKFVGGCYRCKSEMWLPESLYVACKHSSKISFFCPYGHEQIFAEGESELTKVRRERDRLVQQLAQRDDALREAKEAERALIKARDIIKASAVKLRKQAAAGVCPCCHRTVRQMALHMKTKHPTFKAEAVA